MRTMPVAMAGLLGAHSAQQPADELEWMKDVAAAERKAAKTKKPLLLVFR